ncbi:tyrosine-type recombinase/integrase [Chloroflexota bacterium]
MDVNKERKSSGKEDVIRSACAHHCGGSCVWKVHVRDEVRESLCQHLRDFCKQNRIKRGDWVFRSRTGDHMTRQYAHEIVSRAAEAAGVYRKGMRNPKTGGRYKGAHPSLFRHATAVFLLNQIDDPEVTQRQLGHSNIHTTIAHNPAVQRKNTRKIKDIKW